MALRKFVLAIAIGFTATAKAGPSLSDQVSVQVVPTQPIVFTAPIIYATPSGSVTVTPPWFRFGVNLNNNSSQILTIISLTSRVADRNGSVETTTFDPSSFNFTQKCGATSVDVAFLDFGMFLPGDSGGLRVVARNLPEKCPAVYSLATFYVDALPDTTERQGPFLYNTTLQIDGWFGTIDNPTTRFQKVVQFQTQ